MSRSAYADYRDRRLSYVHLHRMAKVSRAPPTLIDVVDAADDDEIRARRFTNLYSGSVAWNFKTCQLYFANKLCQRIFSLKAALSSYLSLSISLSLFLSVCIFHATFCHSVSVSQHRPARLRSTREAARGCVQSPTGKI